MKHQHTIGEAVRMVGHLLEHHGIVGLFVADPSGQPTDIRDPLACSWCMAGACEIVAHTLNVNVFHVRMAAVDIADPSDTAHGSPVVLWERETGGSCGTTPAERIAIARKLQGYTP